MLRHSIHCFDSNSNALFSAMVESASPEMLAIVEKEFPCSLVTAIARDRHDLCHIMSTVLPQCA